jgi:hypothetical protein
MNEQSLAGAARQGIGVGYLTTDRYTHRVVPDLIRDPIA